MEYHYHKIIEELQKRGSSPGLEAVRELLAALGHPERELRIIHIAGTNGKGSVLAFLSSILTESGCRVGRYVSPTIRSYEERFQINGEAIAPGKLETYYTRMEATMKEMEEWSDRKPTLFEVETALAFLYFAEEGVDFALIETGMGGTLDATNVVEHPLLTIISSVSFDHKEFLGDTLSEIAGQKAGIIKEGVPVIVSENVPEVCQVIREQAERMHAPCVLLNDDMAQVKDESVKGSTFIWKKHRFFIPLPGRHQVSNAVTALAAAVMLWEMGALPPGEGRGGAGRAPAWNAIRQGLARTRWPGRLEVLRERPLVIRDGAHNPDGARRLAQFLEKHFTNRRILYIMGVLRDKEYKEMLSYLAPLGREIYVFRPDNPRGLDAEKLAEAAKRCHMDARVFSGVNEALARALLAAGPEDVIVVCGSLSFMENMDAAIWKQGKLLKN